MEKDHARACLGVNAGASVAQIEAAYRRRLEETRECYAGSDMEEREAYKRAVERLEEARATLLSSITRDGVKPGEVFAGHFELRRELGGSRTGMVWLAHDRRRECLVVLKFLSGKLSQDKDLLESLKR